MGQIKRSVDINRFAMSPSDNTIYLLSPHHLLPFISKVSSPGFFFPNRLTQTAGHQFWFTGPVGPVTGGNRLNSNPNSNKFKNSHATGSDRFTGRFDRFTGRFYRFTGRFDRFEIQKLPCNRFTGRFDRFDQWAFMGRPIFFFFFFDLTLNSHKLY